MAELVGVMCCSHAPPLKDALGTDGIGQRLQAAYDALGRELTRLRPDFVVVVYDDHFDNFFLNAFPTFAVGAADVYSVADEGLGGHWKKDVPGQAMAGRALAAGLVDRGFDPVVCHGEMRLDHGVTVPLPILADGNLPAVVPLVVNCVWPPVPTPGRCWDLGRALRDTLDSWPEPARYVVLGTGGLSHQLCGPDFGLINETFDRRVLDVLGGVDRAKAGAWTLDTLQAAGEGAQEVLNWIVCAGVAGSEGHGEVIFYEPFLEAATGMAVLKYAGIGGQPDADDVLKPGMRPQ